jgi:hypothetical protein
MRRLPILAAAVLLAAAFPAAADAQEPCAPPQVTGFLAPQESIRLGDDVTISVLGTGIARIEAVAGPLRVRASRDSFSLEGVFRRLGRQRVAVDAISACGARTTAALDLTVRRACRATRDRAVSEVQCEREQGSVRVLAGGLATSATWLDAPCNDTGEPPPRRVPVARAAACAASPEPYPVLGRLPIRAGRRVTVTLGMPARRVTVRLGHHERGPLRRLRAARPLDTTGRRWRITLPASLDPAHDRLFLGVVRAPGTDRFVAGVSARAAS